MRMDDCLRRPQHFESRVQIRRLRVGKDAADGSARFYGAGEVVNVGREQRARFFV
jgi:hypothetical protein